MQLNKLGNKQLLTMHKTAFLCSRQTPKAHYDAILKWIHQLSPDKDCILCGNHSYMEQEVFTLLLQLKVPIILVLAEAMRTVWNNGIERALKENRILIITHCNATVHQVSQQSADERNQIILSLADSIVIGYCTKGGNIEKQISRLTNVKILSPAFTDTVDKVIEVPHIDIKEESALKKKYTLEDKRQEYGNAYLPWERKADEYLIRLYEEGKSIKELTEIFERNNGAIRSRLKKLGKLL